MAIVLWGLGMLVAGIAAACWVEGRYRAHPAPLRPIEYVIVVDNVPEVDVQEVVAVLSQMCDGNIAVRVPGEYPPNPSEN